MDDDDGIVSDRIQDGRNCNAMVSVNYRALRLEGREDRWTIDVAPSGS